MTFTARGLYAASSKEPRSGGPRALLLLGLVIACIALLGVAALLVSYATSTTEERTASHSGAETLRIDTTANGDVEISEAAPGEDLEITAEVTDNLFTSVEGDAWVDGSAVTAEARCSSWIGLGPCRADFHASVPPGVEVVVDAGTGDVDVSGLEGALDVTATTGDIEVEDVTGDVATDVSTGDLSARGVQGELVARATTGDMEVVDHDGPVDLDNTTGDMSVDGSGGMLRVVNSTGDLDLMDFAADSVEVETTTGNAELRAGTGTLSAVSTTGDVRVQAPEEFQGIDVETTTGNVDVVVPSGAEPVRVDGSTNTGDRDVQVATDPDAETRLVLTTTTGDVRVLPD